MLTDEKFNAARQRAKEFYNGVKEIRRVVEDGDGNKRKIFYSGNLEED